MATATPQEPCEKCKLHASADKHTRPHSDLVAQERRPMKSMFGNVDEADYVCKICGKEWMWETGSYGYGWL